MSMEGLRMFRPGRRAVIVMSCVLAMGAGAAWLGLQPLTAKAQGNAAAPVVLPDFSELAERIGPAVVNIRTTEKRGSPGGPGNGEMEDQMREFFKRFGIPMPNQPQPQPRRGAPRGDEDEDQSVQRGTGSGFIVSADGVVLTNAHVVDGADEVIVTLTDKREFKAKILGADKRTDVAVVKIETTGLPFVKIGDANRLRVGEWVMAIGSPFGLENSSPRASSAPSSVTPATSWR